MKAQRCDFEGLREEVNFFVSWLLSSSLTLSTNFSSMKLFSRSSTFISSLIIKYIKNMIYFYKKKNYCHNSYCTKNYCNRQDFPTNSSHLETHRRTDLMKFNSTFNIAILWWLSIVINHFRSIRFYSGLGVKVHPSANSPSSECFNMHENK